MKKLINRPQDVVKEMIEGYLCMYPGLARLSDHNVIIRRDAENVRSSQVAVISGGGSGHEPAHAGYVGAGMLSAAVAGEVFTSPSADSVFAAIKAVAGAAGALLIVKNYTGDRLNFGLAAEVARSEGIPVEAVIVADDIALAVMQETAGRRGIAGTVFVHKAAGAAAAEGRSLAEVAQIATSTAEAIATMGVCLSSGVIPAVGKPNFTLGDGEVELGLGIHGEPGARRIPLEPADNLVDQLLESILSAKPITAGSKIAVLINNLGATTSMELAIITRRAISLLRSRKLTVERVYAGTFMSSLESAGISLSLLPLNDARLALLDAHTSAPVWPCVTHEPPASLETRTTKSSRPRIGFNSPSQRLTRSGARMQQAIVDVCTALINAERRLTELDQVVGDGDLGLSLARGAQAILESVGNYPLHNPADALRAVGLTFQEAVGGSSGPLYGVLLLRAASSLQSAEANRPAAWAEAMKAGCEAISVLGGAKAGDRTMLDALIPFADALASDLAQGRSAAATLASAAEVAENSAEATAQMAPKRGRSSYLGERTLGHPDPGAVAVAIWLKALASSLARPV